MEEKQSRLNQDTEQMVKEGLAWLRLEHEVKAAAAARQAILRQQRQLRWGALSALVLISAIACFLYMGRGYKSDVQPASNATPPATRPQPVGKPPVATPSDSPKVNKSTPIAANKPTAPRYNAPVLRGESPAADARQKALLDAVWYTEYPAQDLKLSAVFHRADQLLRSRNFEEAYVDLQKTERNLPHNDTLRLLKGYCLLEMGEGSAALEYLQPLEAGHPDWQNTIDWHKALASLLAGAEDDAQQQFRRIANTPQHPYRARSQRALQHLR